MRAPLIAALFLVWPLNLAAQSATIRSGEHDGFTRLVVPVPPGTDWTVRQIGREVSLILPGANRDFDISGVFDLIPRDRVLEVRPTDQGLIISLGCECRVAPFPVSGRFVAIDIASPGETRPVEFVELSEADPQIAERSQTAEKQQTVQAVEEPASAQPPVSLTPFSERALSGPVANLRPMALPQLARGPLDARAQEALDDVQTRLANELGIAATRGLLTPLPGANLPSRPRVQIDTDALVPETKSVADEPTAQGRSNNMRITSSMDFPGLSIDTRTDQTMTGISCPTDAAVDLSNWSDGRSFDQQTGAARLALYGEFDRLDPDNALKLARLYVHFGFGAEALQILALDPDLRAENLLLADIARIMEDGHAPDASLLSELLDCESDVALWAILARPELDVAQRIDPSAALRALNKLPLHLREFLAPALSKRLLSHGDTDAAATALRNLERRTDDLSPSAKMAQAGIAMDEGDVAGATRGLEDVIDENAEQSPRALITLVETRLREGQPIDADTAGLIEAYAKELQGSELGPDLRRAHVLALARSGQFDRAFQATAELGGKTEEVSAVQLRLTLLGELTRSAADVVFLDHVFDQAHQDIERLPISAKLALATRMLDLGFAAQADQVAESVPGTPRNEARQLLLARAALEMELPQRAQAALIEMSGEEVDLLLAQANEMAGAHAEAFALFQQANQPEAAARTAWLAEEWESLTLDNDPVFGPVLELSASIPEISDEVDGMLARSNAALADSKAARQALLDLLNAPELDLQQGETQE